MDLQGFLHHSPDLGHADTRALGLCLDALVGAGLDRLPLPAGGATLQRWQALARVAGHDLGLCKLYEGHTDALAIMAELGCPVPPGTTWGTWAAEPPQARVHAVADGPHCRLSGTKAWCSGAEVLSHALLTAWDAGGHQRLVAVALDQPGVQVESGSWQAVGMASTGSQRVDFHEARGQWVGGPDDYLQRPGFWQGAIGIAACWLGAAQAIAHPLREHCAKRDEPHALAHLGAVDSALHQAACVLRHSARQLDQAPQANCQLLARRARAVTEASVDSVLHHVGRALGAGPYCLDRHFARLLADLPVFIRQSHAERDLAILGQQLANAAHAAADPGGWQL
ncbi:MULTISPECIES: acyl-CoA dehydrogenase [unclassified Pseudomonas]|uniref:acyl-CoA dehydrogenase n=1 Tax=Pseudomonas TaxID=286 RepID=UPI000876AA52|nr:MULTISPECIES: acyl-CoA dehydrogenase [unclassified Pseudomonas]SCZ54834.1 Acyl-CoA dehydrogenase [Pseudomonas sp. NFPP17]SDA44487.1 Acyl-CoA dehydrogenase [Pseudomonas sp. NFPP15]SEK29858.1 Acyl-CoA dehydrogenase [Pseudomonas sp. NFPP18]SFA44226.1 Acyl-CoA dehydrogenase [Pseudomonas sp. NFPP13]SFT47717.1 Acyl-CoA dehydrogenase [Pseudomonas sp. NFPP25]